MGQFLGGHLQSDNSPHCFKIYNDGRSLDFQHLPMNIWREERSLIEREGYLCGFREFGRNVGQSFIALPSAPELLVKKGF